MYPPQQRCYHSPQFKNHTTNMNYPHPQNHVIVKQRISMANNVAVIPVLYLLVNGKVKRVESLVDYFLDNLGRSEQWMRYRARALGYFYDYCSSLQTGSTSRSHPLFHKRLVRGFLISMLTGTVNAKTGLDKLQLYWPSTGIDIVKRICSSLNDIVDYCQANGLVENNLLKTSGYAIPTSEQTALSFLYVASRIKAKSFLSHIINVDSLARKISQGKGREFNLHQSKISYDLAPKRFPEDLIGPLFKYGFVKNENGQTLEEREDIPAKMCCLLWIFGGLRKSEPLHLWVNDIVHVDGYGLKVIQRHPSDSKTHIIGENMTRQEYLKRIGRLPRNQESSKSQRASWKNLALDRSGQAYVYFLHSNAEKLFIEMYNYYLTKVRPNKIAELKRQGKPEHPFLFVSSGVDRNSGKSYVGEPLSVKSLDESFSSALDRVEVKLGIKIPRGRENNTNPHAGRHFYIGSLKDAGVDPKVVQRTVKHGNVTSQDAYDAPTEERIQSVMNNAKIKIESKDTFYDYK